MRRGPLERAGQRGAASVPPIRQGRQENLRDPGTARFPVRQRDLVIEMQEWFIANSAEGEAPDESTIRRQIQSVWKELNPA